MGNQWDKQKRGGDHKSVRYRMERDPRWLAARGVTPLFAAEVLSHVIDERRVWQRVFASKDDRVILDALKFLVSMRDGKPAQQINVTSQSISVSVDDIQRARDIVRELSATHPLPESKQPQTIDGDSLPLSKQQPQTTSPLQVDAAPASDEAGNMVWEDEGGK